VQNYDTLTDLQWESYAASLAGIRVHWEGTVSEVQRTGTIFVDMGTGWQNIHFLEGVPREIAITLSTDQLIVCDATIVKAVGTPSYGPLSIYLNDVTIYQPT